MLLFLALGKGQPSREFLIIPLLLLSISFPHGFVLSFETESPCTIHSPFQRDEGTNHPLIHPMLVGLNYCSMAQERTANDEWALRFEAFLGY
jgi:hypothetical protein